MPLIKPMNTQSSSNIIVNPALKTALNSLDLQLEDELARYRRQRAGQPLAPSKGLNRKPATRKTIELIPVNLPNSDPAVSENSSQPSQEPTQPISSDLSLPFDPTAGASVAVNNIPINELLQGPAPIPKEAGELVPTEEAPPEDYLESSEQLLRSLAEEEAATETESENRFIDNLLTPLGVGSMLLLLLSSATIGYILLDPSGMGQISRLFGSQKTTIAQSPIASTSPVEVAQSSPVPSGPDLTSKEFEDINLDNLSTLPASPSPVAASPLPTLPSPVLPVAPPAVSSNPAVPGPSSDLATALVPVSPSPTQQTKVPSVVPLPRPSVAALPSPVAPKPSLSPRASVSPSPIKESTSRDPYYYVVIDYSDRALEQARSIIPDAYVRTLPNGTKIQLGAFKIQSEANTLVQELQRQGLSASVYRP